VQSSPEAPVAELPQELELVGRDLTAAYGRLLERRRRGRRVLRLASAVVGVFCAFTAVAFGSGIAGDLQLDPAKWAIFDRGAVDGGQGEYVKAHSKTGGPDSTFMVEHDRALPRYRAFLLHERVVGAAGGDRERGVLCTADELTRAESVALRALGGAFPAGTRPEATTGVADAAVQAAFARSPCRGLSYASERERFVFGAIEPRSMLMPGTRWTG
jgi:hypothetical protein